MSMAVAAQSLCRMSPLAKLPRQGASAGVRNCVPIRLLRWIIQRRRRATTIGRYGIELGVQHEPLERGNAK